MAAPKGNKHAAIYDYPRWDDKVIRLSVRPRERVSISAWRAIYKAYMCGSSATEIGENYGLTRQRIHAIVQMCAKKLRGEE